jgi:hypothetical protein
MKGRRLQTVAEFYSDQRRPGDYCKVTRVIGLDQVDYVWYVCDPNGKVGRLADHTVTEHEDGTITVSPSILDPVPGGWHGFLERGEWRQA